MVQDIINMTAAPGFMDIVAKLIEWCRLLQISKFDNSDKINHSAAQLTNKQARGVIAIISLLSWSEATSFTWPLLCEVRSLNTVPRCSSGTVMTMLVQGSSSWTSASLRALDIASTTHDERIGNEVTLPMVREVTDTLTFWMGNANKGPALR